MANVPADLKYSKEHEWIRVEGNIGIVGITWFAQDQLGDVVFVELPEVGRELKQNEQFGVVESVKTVSDLYCPASGKVVEVNTKLESSPELINQDPYGEGWILKLELSNPAELDNLLDAAAYDAFTKEG
ncbi:glycine cleavage system protein GcvH [Symbiobacterium thermophilum]|uniref:Glycine cleavage system H protein n=3 Tax=Symbiobacterium thermophilum TaxID=2734 RepID=GCSH_SYMTH|nr:glycine cleavage system protein GcvH [Symbiobacterium thermophilum]Q67N37.1 RecName: Full=Glycine cleavage system H protein [Symbiobacterium thermophilum IAM 14863]OTA40252.1 MAG: glycine cleavage system protein H [Symbiobacterium thermophilum]BAD40906.1 glycine cleavage system protein H [Symbiobacterium thermophilum IAM 14863]